MPLQRASVPLPLAVGVETKKTKALVDGAALSHRNVILQETGAAKKRPGRTAASKMVRAALTTGSPETDFPLTKAYTAVGHGNALLTAGAQVRGETSNYANATFGGAFTKGSSDIAAFRGPFRPLHVDVERVGMVGAGSRIERNILHAVEGSVYRLFVASGSTVTIQNIKSGEIVLEDPINVNGFNHGFWFPNAAPSSRGTFMGLHRSGTSILATLYDEDNIKDPDRVTTATVLSAALHTDFLWDAARINDDLFVIVFKNAANSGFEIRTFNAARVQQNADIQSAQTPTNSISVFKLEGSDGVDRICGVVHHSGTTLRKLLYATDLTGILLRDLSTTPAFTGTFGGCTGITVSSFGEASSTEGDLTAFFVEDVVSGTPKDHKILLSVAFRDSSSFVLRDDIFHCGLISNAWTIEGMPYVLACSELSDLQPTYFVLGISNRVPGVLDDTVAPSVFGVVAKLLTNRAAGLRLQGAPTFMNPLSEVTQNGNIVTVAILERSSVSISSTTSKQLGIATLDFDDTACTTEKIDGLTFFSGGYLAQMGGALTEHGFHLFPPIPVEAATAGSTNIPAGTYNYKATYSWIDRAGQLHRSAPSTALSVVQAGSWDSLGVTVDTLGLMSNLKATNPSASTEHAEISLYRTEANGTVYYLIAAQANNFNIAFELFSDSTTDATLITGQRLYTTGGVLDNIGPPPVQDLALRRDRMFIIPADQRKQLWFSKPKITNVAYEFNDTNFIAFEQGGGGVAVSVLDDNIVIFKKEAIFIFGGEGPNALGQGAFSTPRRISADVGCIERASVVEIPDGILFKSNRGIYLLSRSLQVGYIGAPVEAYNDKTIIAHLRHPERSEVRFALKDSDTDLVYDYVHKRWVEWTRGYQIAGMAATADGKVWDVATNGAMYVEDATKYTDGKYTMQWGQDMGWIKLNGLSGYQRIWRLTLMGNFSGDHKMTVKLYYDYNETVAQTVVIDTKTAMADERFEFRIKPAKQKCRAFRISMEEDGNAKELSMLSLQLDVGVLPGTARLRAEQGA